MAAVGQFKAEITGVGTHAAAPHNGMTHRDGLPGDCQCPSHRRSSYISPLEPVVLSVSHIEAGNIIEMGSREYF